MTQTNLSGKEKQKPVDTENRPVAATGRRSEARMEREVGISRRKLLYTGRITTRSYCIAQGMQSISYDKP